MDICKIGSVGKSIRCPEYSNGECMNMNHCIYKDKRDVEKFNYARYVIVDISTNEKEKYMNDGYHVDFEFSQLFLTRNIAEEELSKYLNPEEFTIKKVKIETQVS